MYHAVGKAVRFAALLRHQRLTAGVCKPMRQLRDEGYRAVSLDEAVRRLPSMDVNQKLVVITFDDGYRDFCEAAFPALDEFRFTATVFF